MPCSYPATCRLPMCLELLNHGLNLAAPSSRQRWETLSLVEIESNLLGNMPCRKRPDSGGSVTSQEPKCSCLWQGAMVFPIAYFVCLTALYVSHFNMNFFLCLRIALSRPRTAIGFLTDGKQADSVIQGPDNLIVKEAFTS